MSMANCKFCQHPFTKGDHSVDKNPFRNLAQAIRVMNNYADVVDIEFIIQTRPPERRPNQNISNYDTTRSRCSTVSVAFTSEGTGDKYGSLGSCNWENSMSDNRRSLCPSMAISVIVAVLLVPLPAHAQIIVNGSFEQPATSTAVTVNGPANTTGLPGWTVGLVSIDVVNAAGNGFVTGPAYADAQYVDLDGSPGPGQISQTLATTLGQSYILSFAYGNNVVGAQSSNPGATVALTGSNLAPFTVNHSTSTTSNINWTLFSGQFTATGTTAALSFTSTSTGGNGGILLDAVSVTPVPEPGALALSAMSAIGWVTYWRRRWKQTRPARSSC
jgi:hypothetical protein